ncbi:ribonuclease G [Kroppenstedtia eburnea]|uniref:ribonuclease G n=1 Tax=Kroppenstedtia eburnea TaxID=714067 RepID=UPI00362615A3
MEERIETYAEEVPAEIKKWNWGAFFLSWIWGIGNQVWIALLGLVPVVNIVMIFVLGAKGSEWAWKAKNWESVDHFKRVQRLWAIWGTVLFFIGIVVGVLFVVFSIILAANFADVPADY